MIDYDDTCRHCATRITRSDHPVGPWTHQGGKGTGCNKVDLERMRWHDPYCRDSPIVIIPGNTTWAEPGSGVAVVRKER